MRNEICIYNITSFFIIYICFVENDIKMVYADRAIDTKYFYIYIRVVFIKLPDMV